MATGQPKPPDRPLHPNILLLGMVAWLAMVGWWVLNSLAWFEQRTWHEVTAAVEEIAYHRGAYDRLSPNCSTGDGRGPRVVLVTYRYDVGGQSFSSKAYDLLHEGELFCDEKSARARIAELNETKSLTVYVHPDEPHRVVQTRQEGSEVVAVLILLGLVGIGLALWWRRQRRVHRAYLRAQRAYLDA